MCSVCLNTPCHPRCPNYSPPKTTHYCSICNEGIYDGEEYFENENGDIAHWECIEEMTRREFIEWMGYKIKSMKGDDEY